ncbi:MAG: monovalent cation/H(+) antiporter subunit G [Deferribacterales bacterium]
MGVIEILVIISIMLGLIFLTAGTIGIIRFPDYLCKMHALTKADNVGFGFIVLGCIIYYQDIFVTLKLILLWFLVIIGSATFSYLLVTKFYQRDREG